MQERYKNTIKAKHFRNIILEHINNNIKSYIILILFFMVGIILGVIFINNTSLNQKQIISEYINGIINSLKNNYMTDDFSLLKMSIVDKLKITAIIWISGSTIIGIPLIYGIITYKGFCIGYTTASVIGVLGVQKGIIFLSTNLLLQNIIAIPCIIALGISGINFYKSTIKVKNRDNIKPEIYRHTIFSLIMFIGLTFSSIIEVYISSNIFKNILNFL